MASIADLNDLLNGKYIQSTPSPMASAQDMRPAAPVSKKKKEPAIDYAAAQKAAIQTINEMFPKQTEDDPKVEDVTRIEATPLREGIIFDSASRINAPTSKFTQENLNFGLPQIQGEAEGERMRADRADKEALMLKSALTSGYQAMMERPAPYVSDYKDIIDTSLAEAGKVKNPKNNDLADILTAFLPALLGSGLGFGGRAGADAAAQTTPLAIGLVRDRQKQAADEANKLRDSLMKKAQAYIGADKVARESYSGEQKQAFDRMQSGLKILENFAGKTLDEKEKALARVRQIESETNKYYMGGIEKIADLENKSLDRVSSEKKSAMGASVAAQRVNKPTEGEKKAAGFLGVARNAEKTLQSFGQTYPSQKSKSFDLKMDIEHGKTGVSSILKATNIALPTPEERKQMQAEIEWGTAILRNDSGAQITPSEAAGSAPQYFPRFGDTPAIIAQKAAARRQKENALISQSGIAPLPQQTDRPDLQMKNEIPKAIAPNDQKAMDWLKKNPKDPKAPQIKQMLQKKGLL